MIGCSMIPVQHLAPPELLIGDMFPAASNTLFVFFSWDHMVLVQTKTSTSNTFHMFRARGLGMFTAQALLAISWVWVSRIKGEAMMDR